MCIWPILRATFVLSFFLSFFLSFETDSTSPAVASFIFECSQTGGYRNLARLSGYVAAG